MSRHKRLARMTVLAVLFSAGAVFAAPDAYRQYSLYREGSACNLKGADDEKVECWMNMVLGKLRSDGVEQAYAVFSYLYGAFPEFGTTSCHLHAHRIGDAAYYEYLVAEGKTLEQLDFPEVTKSCGYGFFHGFIEHLIQDHPFPEYVTKTCEYLRTRLTPTMGDIAAICYHASGHGFSISKADHLQTGDWGNLERLTTKPLEQCENLPDISEREIEECREGIFNVVSDWMISGNFGLSFNFKHPFALCDELGSSRYACYYEFGQKLQSITGQDPLKAETIARTIGDKTLREMTFGVMVAGMMQVDAPEGAVHKTAEGCTGIADDLYPVCVQSAANGFMEHGAPQKEYEEVLRFCADPALQEGNGEAICYDTLAHRLSRFYVPEKKAEICRLFPEQYRADCNVAP